jgi:hypothetical protein
VHVAKVVKNNALPKKNNKLPFVSLRASHRPARPSAASTRPQPLQMFLRYQEQHGLRRMMRAAVMSSVSFAALQSSPASAGLELDAATHPHTVRSFMYRSNGLPWQPAP